MLNLVFVVSLVAVAQGVPVVEPEHPLITTNYHETIGVPEAARIKAAEEAINFDGTRIVGGTNTEIGKFPYFGGLIITLNSGFTSVCGSSLITNTKAVTAAHCWYDGTNQALQFVVVLGSNFLFSGGTRITTTDVVLHPSWHPVVIANDVAVITIDYVTYSPTIHSIELASGSEDYAGWYAEATGFGIQQDGVGIQLTQEQHHVTLKILDNSECDRFYGGGIVRDSTLCIDGSEGQSTCGGDSGGPLVVEGSLLVGITSWGYTGGCQAGWPAGFARVTYFKDWIHSQL